MNSTALQTRWLTALIVLALISVAIVAVAPAPAVADSDDEIVFEGSGWGHGVGMSQYGAQAMAADPDASPTYSDILGHYYAGSTIGDLGTGGVPSIGDIYVSASSDQKTRTITVAGGPGSSPTGVLVSRGADMTLEQKELFSGDSFTVVDTAPQSDGGCSVAFSDGTVWVDQTADGALLSCDITIPLAPDTDPPPYLISLDSCRTTNCTFAWGTALLLVDNGSDLRTVPDKVCPGDCPLWPGFDVVVQLPVDTYVRGIAEVPFSWHPEALKTQAVAARSYAARSAIRPG
ncbi:MAG: SpoIID/LytB domain-containing protein, partial [Actinomycetota bacterium]|nr:SpoIID/LytB domain-containing protein [Actinomycetota bacterium]